MRALEHHLTLETLEGKTCGVQQGPMLTRTGTSGGGLPRLGLRLWINAKINRLWAIVNEYFIHIVTAQFNDVVFIYITNFIVATKIKNYASRVLTKIYADASTFFDFNLNNFMTP